MILKPPLGPVGRHASDFGIYTGEAPALIGS